MFPHGFFPEYFAAGAEPWLMEALTHPQMAALQEGLHGGGPVRLDHNVMLNRKPGSQGRTWHSHPYDARDSESLDATEGRGLRLVRTLAFPDGVRPEDGGVVGVIPGAHHYKDPWDRPRVDRDESLREGWMKDKVHPATGAPLEIIYPPLPPGSLLCFVHHMPHGTTPRTKGVRWALLCAFRKPDPRGIAAPPPPRPASAADDDGSWTTPVNAAGEMVLRSRDRAIPDGWVAEEAAAGRLSHAAQELLREY